MHRIDGANATPEGLFTEGDAGVGALATEVTADIMNALQEELVNVILATGVALSKPNNTQLRTAIQYLVASAVPAGALQHFAMTAPPSGWLKCNGAAVSRTTYARLFSAIGTTFGVGNGTTTFNVPELRGEFLRALDDGRGVDAGRALGSAQTDMLESHVHEAVVTSGGTDTYSHQLQAGQNSGPGQGDELELSGAILATGGTETRPRNVAMMLCIKT